MGISSGKYWMTVGRNHTVVGMPSNATTREPKATTMPNVKLASQTAAAEAYVDCICRYRAKS
jgi:hypothetical protein